MITPQQLRNPQVKPKWQLPIGVMEGIVAFNCRKYGFPRPVLAMPLWEGAGNRALDYSGHGNHGTLIGPEWVADGLDFTAANTDYVDVGTHDISGGFSIISSVKFDLDTIDSALFGSGTGTEDGTVQFWRDEYTSPDRIGIGIHSTNWQVQYSAYTPDITSFHQYVWTYDDTTDYNNLYVDNTKYITDWVQNAVSVSAPCRIGAGSEITVKNHDGMIEYFYLYDYPLTAAQVKFLHDNPYFMYEIPEELYSYVTAAAGVTLPVFLHLYNQMRQ